MIAGNIDITNLMRVALPEKSRKLAGQPANFWLNLVNKKSNLQVTVGAQKSQNWWKLGCGQSGIKDYKVFYEGIWGKLS